MTQGQCVGFKECVITRIVIVYASIFVVIPKATRLSMLVSCVFFFVSLLLCFVGAVWVGDSVPRIMRGSHSTSPYSLSLCMFYISLVIPNVPCSPYCFFFVLFCDSYFITLNILTLVKFFLWWLVACFAYIFALRFACWRR